MAMVKCPECKSEISSQATACPRCGAPRKSAPKTYGCGTVVLIGFVGLVAFSVWMSNAAKRGDSRPAPVKEAPTAENMAATAINVAKHEIRSTLKDASSAEFRDLRAVKTPAGGLIVCGEVNSKNSFGAMAGFSRFIYNTTIIVHETADPKGFAGAWNGSCAKWTVLLRLKR